MAAPFPSPTPTWHTTTYSSISPSRPELSAKGKTVVVTGGGTGIGAETARCFAEAGAARIALFDRREQPLLDTKASIESKFASVDVFVASTDVTKASEVDAAFAKFVGDGKINVLVSSAAMIGPHDALRDVDASPSWLYSGFGILWLLGTSKSEFSMFSQAWVDTDINREAGGVAALGFEDHLSLPASFNVWLASPEARFMKGKFLRANWDVDELKAGANEIEGSTRLTIGLVGWQFENAVSKPTWKA